MGYAGTGVVHIPVPGKIPRNCKRCGTLFATYKCNTCTKAKNNRWLEKNRDYVKAKRAENATALNAKNAEYYAENKEIISVKRRAFRLANPDKFQSPTGALREKKRLASRAWRLANPERMRAALKSWCARNHEQRKAYRIKNAERVREQGRKRRRDNPEIAAIQNNRRRARIIGAGGTLSKGLRAKLHVLQKGKCACCGKPLGEKYHLDHIMPLALGGPNEDSNIQLLRALCNFQKRAKHPVDFMRQRGFLL